MRLETERLLIRPFTMGDLDEAHRLLDIDIEWSGPDFSLEQRRDRLRFHIALAEWWDSGGIYGNRAIILEETGALIGLCGFVPAPCTPEECALFGPELFGTPPDDPCTSLELHLGYALGSDYRGKGYATEAVRMLVDYAFEEIRVRRIMAMTDRPNTGSIRLMERLGMRTARNPHADWPGVVGILDKDRL